MGSDNKENTSEQCVLGSPVGLMHTASCGAMIRFKLE